ncbi:MAG: LysR family transcriptional regulator [Bacteriovoracaceae bacterium]
MSNRINYHHLFYFMTIAEQGSVSKAAEKLLLGQPTLSAQLKQFEESIGVALFERSHKKLILTEQGKIALDYAHQIFQLGNDMYEALHDRLKPARLSLQLGAIDSIPKQVMLKLTQEAQKVSPCTISLIEGKSPQLMTEIHAHRLDMLITDFLPTPAELQGLNHRRISKMPVSIYGGEKFRHLKKGFPQSINNQSMVVPTFDSQMRYNIDHWIEANKLDVTIMAETQDTALKKLIALNQMALIPAATHTVKKLVSTKQLYEIGQLKGTYEELYLISANRKIPHPIVLELMQSFLV